MGIRQFIDKMSLNWISLQNVLKLFFTKYIMAIKSTIKPPKELTEVGEKSLFKEIIGAYSAEFFNKADIPLIVKYVQLSMSATRCYAEVLRNGEVIRLKNGDLITSPYLKTYTGLCSSMANIAQKLRIAPSARMRQEVPGGSAGKAKASKDYRPADTMGHNTNWKDQQRE